MKKASEELGHVCSGQCAHRGVAGWHTWCQDRDVSVGEVGSWLVGTRSLPWVVNAVLGGREGIHGAAQSVSPSRWIPRV